ncbi:hypothetical protein DVH24_025761 [Malus domestica]|uniref:Sugar phosphate transporter domain-containing protein n=1 Tax=Malus domestica TaxID=3750 RepID=A0A498KLI5_MALDO|nr:hypothetical protein DVH24_025761 [Malus domestica]
MLALKICCPSSPVTFSKSRRQVPSINAPSSPSPSSSSLLTRIQTHSYPLHQRPTSLRPQTSPKFSKFSSFTRIYGYPFGISSKETKPIGQIRDSSSKISHLSEACEFPSGFGRKPRSQIPKAASESNTGGETEAAVSKPKATTAQLALIFGLWYFQNIVFNVYNKKVLNVFPYPWLLGSFQLFAGSVWMFILWSLKLQPRPKISKPFIVALLGPALFHTIGHISACVSFSKVAVSFTHVIKSSEPVFSVVFSSFLGDSYPLQVWLSILPIVMGCALAAITEVSFNVQGLWGALISNVGFVLRNIYSKRSLQNFKEVDGLNLYGWISIISFFYLFPAAIFLEGSQWDPKTLVSISVAFFFARGG